MSESILGGGTATMEAPAGNGTQAGAEAAQTTSQAPPAGTQQAPAIPADHWLSKLGPLPADFKVPEKVLGFKTPQDLLRSYEEAQRVIDSGSHKMPKPDAPEAVWEAYYNKVRPESPEKYSWKPDDADLAALDEPTRASVMEEIKAIKAAAHKVGLDDRQFTGVMAIQQQWLERQQAAAEKATAEAQAKEIVDAKAALTSEWGDKYAENVAAAQRAAKSLGILESLGKSGAGNDPAVLKALARLDAQLGEAKLVGGGASRETIKQQFDTVSKTLMGMNESHPDYPALSKQRADLGKAMFVQ